MAQIIVGQGSLNVPALTADDAYIQVVAPPNFLTGVPTDVYGVVGTASWGPVNNPVHLGSGQDAVQQFGQMSAASLTDPFDMPTALYLAFGQSQSGATLEAFAVRVTDGTDVEASTSIALATSATPTTITVAGTLTVGDGLQVTATSSALTGSPITLTYTTVPGDTPTTMAAALTALINANSVMVAAGIVATSLIGVITIYWPATLGPPPVWTKNVTGTATDTLTIGAGSTGAGSVTITSLYTGSLGNQCSATVTAGSGTNTWDVILAPPTGLPERFIGLPNAGFAQALANAINLGQNSIRGPSNTFSAAVVLPAVGAPSAGVNTFSGGTDGRGAVGTAAMLGSSTSSPPTGMFALGNLSPAVGIIDLFGLTDGAAAATVVAFNQSYGSSAVLSLPTGLTVSAAVTAANATGQADPSLVFAKDWIYFFDTINGRQRLVPSSPVIAGRWTTLQPQQSPGNKTVNLVIGTERFSPQTGSIPYNISDIGMLASAGIMCITNPIPRGRVFGIRHGQSTSLEAATKPAEYWRLTMWLARSAAQFIGQYVDEEQSSQPDDPLRAAFKLQSNTFLKFLKGQRQIDDFLVTCVFSSNPTAQPGLGVNTTASVAQHYMFALWQVKYLSSVRFFVLSLQGGTTVVDVAGQLTQQQACKAAPPSSTWPDNLRSSKRRYRRKE